MKKILATALAGLLALSNSALADSDGTFTVLEPKVCHGIEQNLGAFLAYRYGEKQAAVFQKDGLDWILWRNPTSAGLTLSTTDGSQDCILAHGVGDADKPIEWFVSRVEPQGTAL